VVGCIIGAGIFRLSSPIAQNSPSVFMFFLAWVLGGFLSLCGALTYAELATRFPKTGGDYVFLTNAYGRFWGFLFGWTKLFMERTGTIAIVAYVFAEHACQVFGWPATTARLLAATAIVILTGVNLLGLRVGKNIQNLFTVLKISALFLLVGAGLIFQKGSIQNFQPFWPDWSWSLVSSTGLALIFVLWTLGGWTEAAYVAEEVKDPAKNLPRAIVGGVLAVIGLYLLVNMIYIYYMPLEEMRRTSLVAAGTMDKIWVGRGGQIFSAMVMVSTFGALNGFVITGAHSLRHGQGPHSFSCPHARPGKIPHAGLRPRFQRGHGFGFGPDRDFGSNYHLHGSDYFYLFCHDRDFTFYFSSPVSPGSPSLSSLALPLDPRYFCSSMYRIPGKRFRRTTPVVPPRPPHLRHRHSALFLRTMDVPKGRKPQLKKAPL